MMSIFTTKKGQGDKSITPHGFSSTVRPLSYTVLGCIRTRDGTVNALNLQDMIFHRFLAKRYPLFEIPHSYVI